MTNYCIVTYAKRGREDYIKAMWRMIGSALNCNNPNVDVLYCVDYCSDDQEFVGDAIKREYGVFKDEWIHRLVRVPSSTVPDHNEIPYGFKPALINKAIEYGYQHVLWCDSTIYFHKNTWETSLWNIIEISGIVSTENLGYPLMNWITSEALDVLGVPEQKRISDEVKQITACWIGFNFNNKTALETFNDWLVYGSVTKENGGIFSDYQSLVEPELPRLPFKSHRHDQAILSWLMHEKGFPVLPYGSIFCYYDVKNQYDASDNIIFTNRGIYQ